MRTRSFPVLLVALGVLTACGDDGGTADDGGSTTTSDAASGPGDASTTTATIAEGFCADLADFYETSGAFFLVVTAGEATVADLDRLEDEAEALPTQAPDAIVDDASTVAASIGGLVTALRAVDLADPATITPLLIESTDAAADAAAERLDAYAVDECGFHPEDLAAPD